MSNIKIAAIAGSLRINSYNKMAMNYIISGSEEAGAGIDVLDLKEYDLPVYNFDIEAAGEPSNVTDFRDRIKKSDAVIICTPEYNHGIPGGLKNAIDWASRQNVHPFRGKFIALAGASTGQGGTIRSQLALLPVMRALGGMVLTTQIYISHAAKVFDENGKVLDENLEKRLLHLGRELVEMTKIKKAER